MLARQTSNQSLGLSPGREFSFELKDDFAGGTICGSKGCLLDLIHISKSQIFSWYRRGLNLEYKGLLL
jgi:hypothetical protein